MSKQRTKKKKQQLYFFVNKTAFNIKRSETIQNFIIQNFEEIKKVYNEQNPDRTKAAVPVHYEFEPVEYAKFKVLQESFSVGSSTNEIIVILTKVKALNNGNSKKQK